MNEQKTIENCPLQIENCKLKDQFAIFNLQLIILNLFCHSEEFPNYEEDAA